MDMYTNLLKQGWTLPEIDGMDILFYFRLLRYVGKEKREKITPVDEIGWL